ncbi:GntR family transcriptional regulator [Cryobacterium sp. SO1]|uniref:GntR family transcriptional regulator n=1 Tax=Cryobacterium sp. SO1 TaxID=1897061 RepID=UPI001022F4CE|nr:GntR family transcriptional regulator [Cryobacterium sp. SO1]RZI36490.1 HTH-type transcriptional repressor YtrA [Cryobacterium sp. SO1]
MIHVDADDPTPPFEQIRAGLAAEIQSGRLPGGRRLPTVRQLAGDLHVAVGTVARAYRELEEAGLVSTHRSQGTVVRDGQTTRIDLTHAAADFVRNIRRQDTDLEELITAIKIAWNSEN